MYYATLLNVGVEKLPLIVIKITAEQEEGYEDLLGPLYERIVRELYFVNTKNSIILKQENGTIAFTIPVKPELLNATEGYVLLELQIHVKDFAENMLENYYISAILHNDRVPNDVRVQQTKPLIKIHEKEISRSNG